MIINRKKSGIIIIGDEILSGKTQDTNSYFLTKNLSMYGIDVLEISIISDDEKQIINKVRSFAKKFDYVFTTGGIGPTHDDITSESVSKALKKKYIQNPLAKKLLEKHYPGKELTKPRLKMSFMPRGSKLILNPVSVAPGFVTENVHVLPGVPNILKPMFLEFLNQSFKKNILPKITISTILSEGVIAQYVEEIQNKNPGISIGSYPYFKSDQFGVSLVIKSNDKKKLSSVGKIIFNYLSDNGGDPKYF
tara:strand:- start:743 stop:1489 length:747 start_codon:yes stop_codon:yes gene_type:complete